MVARGLKESCISHLWLVASPGGVSNGSNTSSSGGDASERLSSTIVFNSPNNCSTRPEEAANLGFGVYIVCSIRFHMKLALTFQIEVIHLGVDFNSEVTYPRE